MKVWCADSPSVTRTLGLSRNRRVADARLATALRVASSKPEDSRKLITASGTVPSQVSSESVAGKVFVQSTLLERARQSLGDYGVGVDHIQHRRVIEQRHDIVSLSAGLEGKGSGRGELISSTDAHGILPWWTERLP